MKKIISFSLWGNNKLYSFGAVENINIINRLLNDWIIYLYIGNDVDEDIVKWINNQKNVKIIFKDEKHSISNMFWRFEPVFYENYDVILIRDLDSRITEREIKFINDFINNDKKFHIIRDHERHKRKIMGGLWGVKDNYCHFLKDEFNNFPKLNRLQIDQDFLREKVYPKVIKKSLIHSSSIIFENEYVITIEKHENFIGKVCFDFKYSEKIFQNKDFKNIIRKKIY